MAQPFSDHTFVLSALLNKRSGVDVGDFSRAEAILLTACEFWSAVAARQLLRYLDSEIVTKLLVAFEAFSEIGAVKVASARFICGWRQLFLPPEVLIVAGHI